MRVCRLWVFAGADEFEYESSDKFFAEFARRLDRDASRYCVVGVGGKVGEKYMPEEGKGLNRIRTPEGRKSEHATPVSRIARRK